MLRGCKLVGLLLCLTLIAGCKGTAAQGRPAPVEITFWHAMNGAQGKVLGELVAAFNKSQEQVVVQPVFQQSLADLHERLLAAISTGAPPALAQMHESQAATLISLGALLPVEPMLDPASTADLQELFRQASTWHGKVWTLPLQRTMPVLIYNPELVHTPPQTWDALTQAAREATQRGKDGKVITSGLGLVADDATFRLLLAGAGGTLLDASQQHATFADGRGLQAMNQAQQLVREGAALRVMPSENAEDMLAKRRFAMYITDSSSLPALQQRPGAGRFGAAPVPRGPGRAARGVLTGSAIGVLAGLSEQKRQAAALFLKWLRNPEVDAGYAIKSGGIPLGKAALNSPAWKAHVHKEPLAQAAAATYEQAEPDPRLPTWDLIRPLLAGVLNTILTGGNSAVTLKGAQTAVEHLLTA